MLQAACYECFQTKTDLQLLGVKGEKEAFLASEVALFLGKKSYVLPDLRANMGDDLLSFHEEMMALLRTLHAFYQDASTKKILIAPLRTLLTPLPKATLFSTVSLEFGMRLHLERFREQMFYWGYLAVDVVQGKGEISIRGDIIDIFPPDSEKALRLSLFDDEVESIRFFDCESQKSEKEELDGYALVPALFALDETSHNAMQKRIDALKSDSFTKDIHSLGLWVLGQNAARYTESFTTYLSADALEELDEIALFDEVGASTLRNIPVMAEATKIP